MQKQMPRPQQLMLALLVALPMQGCTTLPSEFSGTDQRDAVITRGQVFGVSIGSTRAVARNALQGRLRSFHFIYTDCRTDTFVSDNSVATVRHSLSASACPEVTEDVFHANIGLTQYANIFVDTEDDRVVRIKWGRGQGYVG